MTTELMDNLTDLDFDLIQMADDELDAFAMACAEADARGHERARTPVAFAAPRDNVVAARPYEIPERAAA